MPTLEELVHNWHMAQPSPQAPSLTVGDYAQAMRLAATLSFGGDHPTPQAAANLWREYQQMNQTLVAQKKLPVGPEEFQHLAQQMARSSFAYHGRPPSMYEIGKLRDAKPGEVSDYYGSLPDEHYPSVPAAEMVKALHAARPWALMVTGQEPTKLDGAYLFHSGQNPRDWYQARAQHDGTDNSRGPQPGVAGPGDAGGQQVGQRAADTGVASGPPSSGGPQGVSQG